MTERRQNEPVTGGNRPARQWRLGRPRKTTSTKQPARALPDNLLPYQRDMPPKVSIIIPAYNAEKTLPETLDSACACTYEPLEIIVVDDGSTDGTLSIAHGYAARDARIKVLHQENAGACHARNHAIGESTGEYILPLDADDIIVPEFISLAAATLDMRPEVKVVQPRAHFFGMRSGEWRLPMFSRHLLARRNMIEMTSMYRRADWERVGGYCEEIIAREDWEFWISILKDGGEVVRTEEVMHYYRIVPNSKRVRDRLLFHHVVKTLNRRHPDFFFRELGGPLRYWRTWSRLLNALYFCVHPRRCKVSPEFAPLKPFVQALRQRFRVGSGELIFMNRNEIREFHVGGEDIIVKSFRVPNLVNRIVYGLFRKSKAERSYNYAQMLKAAGIGSPTPVGWLEQRRGFLFTYSYYASLRSTCPLSYMDVIALSRDERDEYLRAIAATTAQMHERGWLHTDYSRGNILCGRADDGTVKVEIIDLNRIRFREVDCRTGCRNFERLPGDDEVLTVIADEYARLRGFDAALCRSYILEHREN